MILTLACLGCYHKDPVFPGGVELHPPPVTLIFLFFSIFFPFFQTHGKYAGCFMIKSEIIFEFDPEGRVVPPG